MTWYYDLSPFSLACSCILESSLGLMCRNGASRFPSPCPRQRACGRPGRAGQGRVPSLQPPPAPHPAGPFPCPLPCPGVPCPLLSLPGPAQRRWHGLAARRRPGRHAARSACPGSAGGLGCHRAVTMINMAATCGPHGAGSAACPRAWLPAQPEAFPWCGSDGGPGAAVPPLPVPL